MPSGGRSRNSQNRRGEAQGRAESNLLTPTNYFLVFRICSGNPPNPRCFIQIRGIIMWIVFLIVLPLLYDI